MLKYWKANAVVALLLAVLTACGGAGRSEAPPAAPARPAPEAFRTVTHDAGTSRVPAAPQRVAVLSDLGMRTICSLWA